MLFSSAGADDVCHYKLVPGTYSIWNNMLLVLINPTHVVQFLHSLAFMPIHFEILQSSQFAKMPK